MFINSVKQRLNDVFIQNWFAGLSDSLEHSNRAKTYSLFANFRFQPYLYQVTLYKFRSALTRLRVSAHRLSVETGRWHKPRAITYNERKCIFCNQLEDEFHFLLECSLYNDLRRKYIKKYFWNNPSIPKFVDLLSSDNEHMNVNIAMFVQKGFEKRKQYL